MGRRRTQMTIGGANDWWIASLLTVLLLLPPAVSPAAQLVIEEGDHICIIGGGVADAMQHTGWLEVMLQSRFPESRLTIRNLAVDGDEVYPAKRLRSADFGSPDQGSPAPPRSPGQARLLIHPLFARTASSSLARPPM